jgi:hypothetical protein
MKKYPVSGSQEKICVRVTGCRCIGEKAKISALCGVRSAEDQHVVRGTELGYHCACPPKLYAKAEAPCPNLGAAISKLKIKSISAEGRRVWGSYY